jgi:hypothetical protein
LIDNLPEAENGPIDVFKNRPIEQLVHSNGRGKWISNKVLEEFAVNIYHIHRRGITFVDLSRKLKCSKKKAQRKLKNVCSKNKRKLGVQNTLLFTINRTNPQQYFPTCIQADIIENLKQNRPINPTGVSLYQSQHIENLKTRYVSELLSLLQNQPIYIHKPSLKLKIDKNYYEEIDINQATNENKSKVHEEKIGLRNVRYEVYPHGTVMIYISCSECPFKLAVEEDISSFFSFLGQVKDRFVYLLNDFSERAIPPIMDWILVQCDINQDIGINIVEQLSIPDLQLRIHDRIFRLYVKSINGNAYYRVEESKQVNQEIRFALPEIMNIAHVVNQSYYDSSKFHYIQ